MGNTPSAASPLLEHAFTDEGMGIPYSGDTPRLVVAMDIGATHSGVVIAFLRPSTFLVAIHSWLLAIYDPIANISDHLEATPTVFSISHWPGQEANLGDNKVPSVLLYDSSEV